MFLIVLLAFILYHSKMYGDRRILLISLNSEQRFLSLTWEWYEMDRSIPYAHLLNLLLDLVTCILCRFCLISTIKFLSIFSKSILVADYPNLKSKVRLSTVERTSGGIFWRDCSLLSIQFFFTKKSLFVD